VAAVPMQAADRIHQVRCPQPLDGWHRSTIRLRGQCARLGSSPLPSVRRLRVRNAHDADQKVVGATGFEPATFRPPAERFRCLCVPERPSRPMCPGPWTIWTDRTMHRVPKRYHGTGSRSGTPVRRAFRTEGCLQARVTAPPSAAKGAALHGKQKRASDLATLPLIPQGGSRAPKTLR
jgi:hypothetical protein